MNLTFFAHWLPWQQPPFLIFSTLRAVTQYCGYAVAMEIKKREDLKKN
jgi:hypothetical protein